jgi:hypothetical protein
VVSALTLAALRDSGWYDVGAAPAADALLWGRRVRPAPPPRHAARALPPDGVGGGRGRGCAFAEAPCLSRGNDAPDTWCASGDLDARRCTFDRASVPPPLPYCCPYPCPNCTLTPSLPSRSATAASRRLPAPRRPPPAARRPPPAARRPPPAARRPPPAARRPPPSAVHSPPSSRRASGGRPTPTLTAGGLIRF